MTTTSTSQCTALVVHSARPWWDSEAVRSVSRTWKFLARVARLMVGQPDYDAYVQHMLRMHPERPVMSYAEFFRDRQDARYGGKGGSARCC